MCKLEVDEQCNSRWHGCEEEGGRELRDGEEASVDDQRLFRACLLIEVVEEVEERGLSRETLRGEVQRENGEGSEMVVIGRRRGRRRSLSKEFGFPEFGHARIFWVPNKKTLASRLRRLRSEKGCREGA